MWLYLALLSLAYMSIYVPLSVSLLSLPLFLSLSLYLSISLSLFSLSVYLSLPLSLSPSLNLSTSLSLPLYLPIYLSISTASHFNHCRTCSNDPSAIHYFIPSRHNTPPGDAVDYYKIVNLRVSCTIFSGCLSMQTTKYQLESRSDNNDDVHHGEICR